MQQQQQTAAPKTARPASGQRRTSQQQQVAAPQQQLLADYQQPQQQHDSSSQSGMAQAAASSRRSLEATQPEDVYMDSIIHKLQLLNYEREFCKRKKPYRRGLTPYYFAAAQPASGMSISSNEQYFYFSSLATWLLQLCGSKVALPKEHDDPNVTLTLIMQGLRELDFAPPSYPHTKLLAGWGREVCALLDGLLDAALEARGLTRLPKTVFAASSSSGQQDGGEDEAVVEEEVTADDDAADITSQAAAALLAAQDSGSSDDSPMAFGMMRGAAGVAAGEGLGGGQQAAAATAAAAAEAASPTRQVLVSTVDPVAWKLEVERVAPKLRVAAAPGDMRDWRQHLEAAHTHMATLSTAWPDVRSQLESLSGEVCVSLEKLEGREQQLTGQFNGLLQQYREARQTLTDMHAEFSRRTELISERNNELHRVAAALEDAKQQLEARGSNLTDASPLVRLKGAMSSLRDELKGMELRIGVVAHNLMTLSIQDKQAALQDAAKRRGKDASSGSHGSSNSPKKLGGGGVMMV